MVAIRGGLGVGKVSKWSKKRTLARRLLAAAKRKNAFTIGSTTVTLDQRGDQITMSDAMFVKYNRMNIPLEVPAKLPVTAKTIATLQAENYQLRNDLTGAEARAKEAERRLLKLLDRFLRDY